MSTRFKALCISLVLAQMLILVVAAKLNNGEKIYLSVEQETTSSLVSSGFCKSYREWQVKFVEEVDKRLNDPDPKGNMSWGDFLNFKEGNTVENLERQCASVPRLPGSYPDF